MGSCLSNDKKPDDKEELSCQYNQQTKIEQSMIRRITQMSFEEKLDYVQSTELMEFMRVCSQKDALKEILNHITPSDNDQLIKFIKSIMAKIQILKDKTPPTNHPNHSQFTSVIHHYSLNLEGPLADYLKGKTFQTDSLKQCFQVTEKTLLVLQCLQDRDLKDGEKWWGTGTSHQALFQEMDDCIGLFDANVKKIANDYLSELYGNLNMSSDKGDVVSQVLRDYFPKLYKQSIDFVASRH